MSLEMADAKGVGGWLVAAGLAIVRVFTKVDEGRIYDGLKEIKSIVEDVRADVGVLKVDVALLKDHEAERKMGGTATR